MAQNNLSKAQLALFAYFASQLLITLPPSADAANILFFLGFGSPSHRLAMQPLANALAAKGNNVSFIVQDPVKNDGSSVPIHYHVAEKLSNHFKEMRKGTDGGAGISLYEARVKGGALMRTLFVQTFGPTVCENLYTDRKFMDWLDSTQKFDLVIMDALFNECGYGLAFAHGAKTMIFSVSTMLPWWLEGIGMPDETAWIPDVMFGIPLEMTFAERAFTAVAPVLWKLFRQFWYFPRLEQITREGLGRSDIPSFAELERNTSLVLLNTHPAQEFPRALPPNVISVGGMSWSDKKKEIPKNMEDFINEGKEGFVYVSFGSFIDFLTFPPEVQQTFINGLKRFPNIQFIWKLNKTPENLPKHILVEKWLPQQDLLLHPKIRGFITHSGIGGVTEAIHAAVPLICFPVLSEQDYNAQIIEKKGFGLKLEITKLTEQDLVVAITKMITDKSMAENAKKVARQFLDRPMKPVETAIWWTEYVLRQESTDFMRSQNVDQSWWKKRQLDVWLFILILTISVNSIGLYVTYRVVKCLVKKFKSNSKSAENDNSKKSKASKKGKQKQN